MSKTKDEANLNLQIEELRDRMRMLREFFFSFCNPILVFLYTSFLENDRKSNVDVLESNKNANKEDIKRLREENKELRQKYAQLQRVLLLFACKEKWFSNYLQCIDYCTR